MGNQGPVFWVELNCLRAREELEMAGEGWWGVFCFVFFFEEEEGRKERERERERKVSRKKERRRGRGGGGSKGDAAVEENLNPSFFSAPPPKKHATHLRFDNRPRSRGRRHHREQHEGREGRGQENPRGREGGGLAGHLFFFFFFEFGKKKARRGKQRQFRKSPASVLFEVD